MRTMRILVAVAALALLATACGDDDAATTTQPGSSGTTTAGTPTTSGSSGSGANGSITFQIGGDYEASGEFPFVPAASTFSNGGWSATFGQEGSEAVIAMNTFPGSVILNYGDPEVVITALDGAGCSFDFDQNDASGLVGSFTCSDAAIGFRSGSGAALTVDFSGEFSAHP